MSDDAKLIAESHKVFHWKGWRCMPVVLAGEYSGWAIGITLANGYDISNPLYIGYSKRYGTFKQASVALKRLIKRLNSTA